jgi:hypothetical protein
MLWWVNCADHSYAIRSSYFYRDPIATDLIPGMSSSFDTSVPPKFEEPPPDTVVEMGVTSVCDAVRKPTRRR